MDIKGSEIVKRIDDSRIAQKMTRKDVAMLAGLKSAQSIIDWDKGSIPQADAAVKVAKALGVSIRWLLTGVEENGLTPNERVLIEKFRNLTDQDMYEILALVDAKLNVKKMILEEKKDIG